MQRTSSGFTLVELIVVLVISGILASISTDFITMPTKAYIDLSRRAILVDTAELALRRMQRDIRQALPNSIRITGGGSTIEMLHSIDGGRYRYKKAADGSGDVLEENTADSSFDVIGTLNNFSAVDTANDQLVIYNIGAGLGNAYRSGSNNRTTLNNASSATRMHFSSKKFPWYSPQQRFFIIDTPVTYRCDTSPAAPRDRTLRRYDQYAITQAQQNPPPGTGKIQANYLSACSFSYQQGTASRAGLVTVELMLTDDSGESVRLLHQIHVDNLP